MFSRKAEPDLSADDCEMSFTSASFDCDANFDKSHWINPGIGLIVAKVFIEK